MYSVRPFAEHEWQKMKTIRLEALKNEPGNFGGNYADNLALSDEEWQQRLQKSDQKFFALCAGDEIVGMTGVYLKTPEEATLIASYIRAEYRGKGLSRLLYEARIDWARKAGAKTVIVSHRKSNLASMRANQNFGFEFTHEKDDTWPDGNIEPNVYYRLALT